MQNMILLMRIMARQKTGVHTCQSPLECGKNLQLEIFLVQSLVDLAPGLKMEDRK